MIKLHQSLDSLCLRRRATRQLLALARVGPGRLTQIEWFQIPELHLDSDFDRFLSIRNENQCIITKRLPVIGQYNPDKGVFFYLNVRLVVAKIAIFS